MDAAPSTEPVPSAPRANLARTEAGYALCELVVNRERSDKDQKSPTSGDFVFACENPSTELAWLFPDGTITPLRCGRSNACAYCAWLACAENMRVVHLDAREEAPMAGMTLTTRNADFDMARFRRAAEALFKWMRRHYGRELGYLMLMEWTTGAGGHGRLPHAHVLLKRLDPGTDLSANCELWRGTKDHWERYTGAWRVEVRRLLSAGGAVAYMVGHHHKREQAPPEGFTGKRFRPSKNYFVRPVLALREEARAERRATLALAALALQYGAELDHLDVEALLAAKLAEPPPELIRLSSLHAGAPA